MLKQVLPVLCLLVPVASAWAQTEAPAPAPAAAEAAAAEGVAVPEKILVVGQKPGPGLWKVSKDGHVLWVFGSYSPLPQKMEWRSQQVENVLAQSQEYLAPPGALASVGFFRGLTLLPKLIGVKKNPDGATLKEVLPANVYARWLPLKAKYLGDDDGVERERPIFAAETLYRAGLQQAGLAQGHQVESQIHGMVKRHNIKVVRTGIALPTDDASAMLKEFKKSPLADTACFAKTLERLESDIDAMRVRANAWAKGDLEAIQKLTYPDHDTECRDAVMTAEFTRNRPGYQDVKERIQAAWLDSAEKALAANTTTFATLRLADILKPDGYLAALKAKGYTVESPD
jgi:uncharacterized protein YbaP (TraB family)